MLPRDKNSYYIKEDDRSDYLEEATELASLEAAKEAFGRIYNLEQLSEKCNRDHVTEMSSRLLKLIYQEETKRLPQTNRKELKS